MLQKFRIYLDFFIILSINSKSDYSILCAHLPQVLFFDPLQHSLALQFAGIQGIRFILLCFDTFLSPKRLIQMNLLSLHA